VKRIAIIGGGISGLAVAYELERQREHGITYTLYEATDRLGGTVETVRRDGFVIECGPDSWVTEKPWAREIAEELGLADEILPSNDAQRRTYVVQGETLQALPDGMRMMVPTEWESLLSSPLFSEAAKQAYQQEPGRAEELRRSALLARGDDADESVDTFVRRHFGEEVANKIAGPLLAGVFGGDIRRLSVRSVMAPFVQMEAEHGSLIIALARAHHAETQRRSIFTTLTSGLGTLTERMANSLSPSSIRRGTLVTSICRTPGGWRVAGHQQDASDAGEFHAVVLATSLESTRLLLHSTGDTHALAAADLLPAEASSSIVVALGFVPDASRGLKIPPGFGFLVPTAANGLAADDSLLACTFVNQKFAHRVPHGGVLLRAFFGGAAADRLLNTADLDLVDLAQRQLSHLLGTLPEPQVTVVRRWPGSLPQYTVGHNARMQRLAATTRLVDGLALVGNAYHGVGLPDLIRDGRATAREIVRTAAASPYNFAESPGGRDASSQVP
jgi:protoporphyrinogen/coproporphyrinogen III oxidase